MNFTADVVISDTEGNVVITLSQSAPFPEGNYRLLYTIHDEPSGNTFEISKAVNIVSENV